MLLEDYFTRTTQIFGMGRLLPRIYSFLEESASTDKVFTTAFIFAVAAFIIKRNEKARSVANKRKSLMKVSINRSRPSPPRSPSSTKSPLAPVFNRIEESGNTTPVHPSYLAQIDAAIEKAVTILSRCDLTGASVDEICEVLTSLHPKRRPSAFFISSVMNHFEEWQNYDWEPALRRHHTIENYKRSAAKGPPFATSKGHHGGAPVAQANPQASAKSGSGANNSHWRRPSYERTRPARRTSSRDTQTVAATRDLPTKPRQLLSRAHAGDEERPVADVGERKNNQMVGDFPGASLRDENFPELYLASGAVDQRDFQACDDLRARIGSEGNAVVCSVNHPKKHEIQPWRLVPKTELPLRDLFERPEIMEGRIPDNFFITHIALEYILGLLAQFYDDRGGDDNGAEEDEQTTDEATLGALISFGTGFEGAPDVENMKPYFLGSEESDDQRMYWREYARWKERSLRDIGVQTSGDGSYLTNGEKHFQAMGWEAQLPGQNHKGCA